MDDSRRKPDDPDAEGATIVSFDEAIEKIAKAQSLTTLKALEMLIRVASTLYTVERTSGGIGKHEKDEYIAKNLAMMVIFNGLVIQKLGMKEEVNDAVEELLAHYYQQAVENEEKNEEGGEETTNNNNIH